MRPPLCIPHLCIIAACSERRLTYAHPRSVAFCRSLQLARVQRRTIHSLRTNHLRRHSLRILSYRLFPGIRSRG